MQSGVLTHATLLDRAASAGEPLALKELLRWRRQGLLPPAERVKGSWQEKHLVYPPETEFVVLALCRLRHRFRTRAAALPLALWVEGFPVPLPRVHQALHALVNTWLRSQQSQEDPLISVLNGLKRVLRKLEGQKNPRYAFSPQTRWKHQRSFFTSLLVRQLPAGQVRLTSAVMDERVQDRLLVHFLLLAGEYLQAPPARRSEWSLGPLERQLSDVKQLIGEGAFSLAQLVPADRGSTLARLELARTDYHRCLRLWQRIAQALERVGGSTILRHEGLCLRGEAPWIQAWALLILLRMRTLGRESLLDDLEQFFGLGEEHMSLMAPSQHKLMTPLRDGEKQSPSA